MNILRNYIYNLSYQILIIITPIITVPYISRTIGANGIGEIAYTNSIVSYFVLIANLGLSLYGSRSISYTKDNENKRNEFFRDIVYIKLLTMIFSIILLSIFINLYSGNSLLLMAQGIQVLAVGLDISWYYIGLENFKSIATRNILVKLLAIILIFMFVKNENDIVLYALINAGSVFIGNLFLWKNKLFTSLFKFNNIKLSLHYLPVLSLFIPQVTTTAFVSINRIFLGNFSTYQQTGFFDNSDKIIRILLALITSIGTVFFPRIANAHSKNDSKLVEKYLSIAFNAISAISIPITIGMLIVSKTFSNLFFGSSFHGINIVLSILGIELIFMGWSSVIGQQYLVATNKVKGLTLSMVISLIFSIILAYFLIPSYGAIGASLVSVFGELLIAIVQVIYIRKFINLKSLFSEVWKILISGCLMYVLVNFISIALINNILPALLVMIIQIILGFLIYSISMYSLKSKVSLIFIDLIKEKLKI